MVKLKTPSTSFLSVTNTISFEGTCLPVFLLCDPTLNIVLHVNKDFSEEQNFNIIISVQFHYKI